MVKGPAIPLLALALGLPLGASADMRAAGTTSLIPPAPAPKVASCVEDETPVAGRQDADPGVTPDPEAGADP